ncbi:uncharacterized protein KZ484_011630 isoform 2-T2 [Pholidichthys leucotaenia]
MRLQTTTDVPQQNDFNQEEVLDEQQFLDQERNFIVVQVEADCSQIKEEQEDICISQEGEQFGLKQEPQTFEEVRVAEAAVQAEKPRLPSPQPPAPDLQRGYQGVPRPTGRCCLSSEFWV